MKHRDLAQAGWITGIVGLVLGILATLAWAAIVIVAIATDGEAFDEENKGDRFNSSADAAVRLALAAARLLTS